MGTRLSHWCRGCGHHIDTHAPNRCNGLTTVDVVEQQDAPCRCAAFSPYPEDT